MSSRPIVVSVPDGDLDPALHYAAGVAARQRRPVRLVHCYGSAAGPPAERDRAAAVLRRAVTRAGELAGPAVDVSGALLRGPAVESVLDQHPDAGVVVIQRRDILHVIRSLTRTTGRGASRLSAVPLACVPPGWSSRDGDDRPVTVGIDDPERGSALLGTALDIARQRGTALHVLHTWSFPEPYDQAILNRVGREWEAWAREDIGNLVRDLRDVADVPVRIDVQHGPPLPALLAAAAGSQLLVLGRHGAHHVVAPRLGPVSRSVLHEAECPVLLLPAAPAAAPEPGTGA